MSKDDIIRGEGRVVAALPNGTLQVEMPNGFRTLAFAPARERAKAAGLKPGDRVTLEFSAFDLSRGRIKF